LAISTTATFNPDIGEIVEEAYERAGLEMRSGYDLRTARRSLNFLTLEWQNRGLNLWTVDEQRVDKQGDDAGTALFENYLVKDVASYVLDSDTIGVLDLVLRMNDGVVATQVDYTLNRISESSYSSIPNKLIRGRPLQYYLERRGILDTGLAGKPANRQDKIHLWPVPDSGETSESADNKYKILYWRVRRIADSGLGAAETMEVPARFLPALVSGLAYHIAMKRPEASDRAPMLKQVYEETFRMAAEEDREKAPLRFVPRISGY
tara:strand:+ start:33 stop:824 length:792 start_codon:yes stop_codon:yes gene_type:complete